jgi:hypothetical protein
MGWCWDCHRATRPGGSGWAIKPERAWWEISRSTRWQIRRSTRWHGGGSAWSSGSRRACDRGMPVLGIPTKTVEVLARRNKMCPRQTANLGRQEVWFRQQLGLSPTNPIGHQLVIRHWTWDLGGALGFTLLVLLDSAWCVPSLGLGKVEAEFMPTHHLAPGDIVVGEHWM